MPITFKSATKHGTECFLPGISLGFADDGAEAYFKAAFGADETDEPPLHIYPVGTVEIDPLTTHAATGEYVQPALAEARLAQAKALQGDDANLQQGA